MKKKYLKKFFNIILLAISFGILIYFCISDDNLVTLINSIESMDLLWLFISFAAVFLSWVIDCICIKFIADYATGEKYSMKEAFSVTMIGAYFGAITPFAAGSQPAQVMVMNRRGMSTKDALSIVMRKYLVYQSIFIAYFLIAFLVTFTFFDSKIPGFIYLSLFGLIFQSSLLGALILFSLNKKISLKIINISLKILKKFHIIKNHKKTFDKIEEQMNLYIDLTKTMNKNVNLTLKICFLTFIQITILLSVPFFIYKAFYGNRINPFDMIFAQSIVNMTSSSIPLPGSTGASEESFIVIFTLFFSKEIVKQAMLLWRFVTYYFSIIFGMIFTTRIRKKSSEELTLNSKKIFNQPEGLPLN